MTITEPLMRRFCKDTAIPIKIFEEPYFSEFLNLYDKHFDAIAKYQRYVNTVEYFGDEGRYFEAYNKVKDDAITYLNENPAMIQFARLDDFNKFACVNKDFPTRDVFKQTNIGKYFVSIDIIKGNFTALRHYNPEIVDNKDTYEEFIGKFTDKTHFIESKYIRQVIFGNVNPKRQVTYEKYLMDKVLTKLFEAGIDAKNVEMFSSDEIVLSVPDEEITDVVSQGYIEMIMSAVNWARENNINVRCEVFKLRKIYGTDGYIKEFVFGKNGVDFKCVDFLSFPFVLRKFYGQPVEENDKIFLYEDKKVKLIEDMNISFSE